MITYRVLLDNLRPIFGQRSLFCHYFGMRVWPRLNQFSRLLFFIDFKHFLFSRTLKTTFWQGLMPFWSAFWHTWVTFEYAWTSFWLLLVNLFLPPSWDLLDHFSRTWSLFYHFLTIWWPLVDCRLKLIKIGQNPA